MCVFIHNHNNSAFMSHTLAAHTRTHTHTHADARARARTHTHTHSLGIARTHTQTQTDTRMCTGCIHSSRMVNGEGYGDFAETACHLQLKTQRGGDQNGGGRMCTDRTAKTSTIAMRGRHDDTILLLWIVARAVCTSFKVCV